MTKALTIDDIRKDILEYVAKGGDIYAEPRTTIPYYERLKNYCKRLKRNGEDVTLVDVYARAGVFFDPIYDGLYPKLAEVAKANDGKLDAIRNMPELYAKVSRAKRQMGLPLDEWVALMTPFGLDDAYVSVEDYAKVLRKQLIEFLDKHGSLAVLRQDDPALYNKVRHFRNYAPLGSFSSIEEALNYLGFSYEGAGVDISYSFDQLKNKLSAAFPKGVVDKFEDINLYKEAIRVALYFDMSLTELFERCGLVYSEKNTRDRLRYMKVSDGKKQAELKEIYNSLAKACNFRFDIEEFEKMSALDKIAALESQKQLAVAAARLYAAKYSESTGEGDSSKI